MNAFDLEAKKYDGAFSDTPIGGYQRRLVWELIEKSFNEKSGRVLEINAGTGKDAVFLKSKGFDVTATDGSRQMVAEMEGDGVHAIQWDLNDPLPEPLQGKYDLIFSNFSGLNCISANRLKELELIFKNLLNPGGKMILIVFGTRCIWEWNYMFWTGRWSSVFRRHRKQTVAMISEQPLDIWYHSISELSNALKAHFKLTSKNPIAFFVPPSYVNKANLFPSFLSILYSLDRKFLHFSKLSSFADHTFLVFEQR